MHHLQDTNSPNYVLQSATNASQPFDKVLTNEVLHHSYEISASLWVDHAVFKTAHINQPLFTHEKTV